jgi:hypothetical protein
VTKIKETTKYDNFLDKQIEVEEEPKLGKFLGIEEKKTNLREQLWVGMPEYIQETNAPYKTIYLHFRNQEDFEEFVAKYKLVDDEQTISDKTKTMWYPKLDKDENRLKRYFEEE